LLVSHWVKRVVVRSLLLINDFVRIGSRLFTLIQNIVCLTCPTILSGSHLNGLKINVFWVQRDRLLFFLFILKVLVFDDILNVFFFVAARLLCLCLTLRLFDL
jgi:hypothetical protein